MGEMTQGQKLEQEYFRTAGHLRAALVLQIADSLTGHMRSAMVTGNAYGTRVIGKMVTRNALRSRGLIDDANMWTALGWAVVLRFVTEDAGWNPDHFKTPDQIHAEALQEDAERFPIPGNNGDLTAEEHERSLAEPREDVRKNGPTPRRKDGISGPIAPTGWTRLDDRSRHVLTGVEVVIIVSEVGPAHFEARVPRWIDGRKLMETVYRGSRFSAANWAMKVAVPDALYRLRGDHEYALRIDAQRTARRNRVQRVYAGDGRVIEEVRKPPLPGWTPEHPAKLAAEARNKILTMDVRPGSLAEAAAIVDGVVKTAQLAVLQRLAAIIDQRESDIPGERIPADEVRHMLRNIAHQFRIEWP